MVDYICIKLGGMKFFYVLAGVLFFYTTQAQKGLSPGIWRGELLRSDGNAIVVNFEITTANGDTKLVLLNAGDRLEADDIEQKGDSVWVKLPFFDSQFRLKLNGRNQVTGKWIKTLADRDVVIPFTAKNKQPYRFKIKSKQKPVSVAGRWSVSFVDTITQRSTPCVGIFSQTGNKLTGTFLTPYGDYRYLEGVVDGDSLKLSGFDGGYAQLFKAKVGRDGSIEKGEFFTGAGAATQVWNAVRDDNAVLPDASAAAHVKDGMEPRFDFTFNDVDGHPVSINDERYKNKVIILQILGSWCPNCLDEAPLFIEMYNQYKKEGLEIIGLSYERTEDFAKSQRAVRNFVQRLKINYPVLIAPVAVGDTLRTEKTLPQLTKIPAFPTTIFIGRDGKISSIHSGFTGPGAGEEEYNKQKAEYRHIVEELLGR